MGEFVRNGWVTLIEVFDINIFEKYFQNVNIDIKSKYNATSSQAEVI